MKLVLDTNTVVSGLLWRNAPRLLMDAAVEGRIELAASTALVDELTRVITRAKFARKLAEQGLTPQALVDRYAKLAKPVTPASIRRTVPKDADDDAVLACALAAQADFIVTGDAHLLNMKRYHGMRIIDAAQALRSLAQ